MKLGVKQKCEELGIKMKESKEYSRLKDRETTEKLQEYYNVKFEEVYIEFLIGVQEVEESEYFGIHGVCGYVDIFRLYTIDEVVRHKESYEDRIPREVFPIAETHDGDLVCLDTRTGGVYYWYHEGEYLAVNNMKEDEGLDDYRENMEEISANFEEFLLGLERSRNYSEEDEENETSKVPKTREEMREAGFIVTEEVYEEMLRLRDKYI